MTSLRLRPGKNWHAPKSAFRPNSKQTSYAKRLSAQKAAADVKAKEREMKAEKEEERQVCRDAIYHPFPLPLCV